jgi:hypothetical protein
MEAYMGAETQLHSLTLVLYGGKCLTPGSGRFITGKEPGTNWIGGWEGPRADLDVLETRKISFPYRHLKPEPSSPVAVPTALPGWKSFNTYIKKREMVQTCPENLGVSGKILLCNLDKYGVEVQ